MNRYRTTVITMAALGLLNTIAWGHDAHSVIFYRGELGDTDVAVEGACDFEFSLWTAERGGKQVGASQVVADVFVVQGSYFVHLDFGDDPFAGPSRYLEVSYCCPTGCAPSYDTLPARMTLAPPDDEITGSPETVLACNPNSAPGNCATASGGSGNSASGEYSTVGGGSVNTATAKYSTVGGGNRNSAIALATTIAGGSNNTVSGSGGAGFIGGGSSNRVSGVSGL